MGDWEHSLQFCKSQYSLQFCIFSILQLSLTCNNHSATENPTIEASPFNNQHFFKLCITLRLFIKMTHSIKFFSSSNTLHSVSPTSTQQRRRELGEEEGGLRSEEEDLLPVRNSDSMSSCFQFDSIYLSAWYTMDWEWKLNLAGGDFRTIYVVLFSFKGCI